ncbi:MAG: Probable signal peptide protein [uncultured Paraburkholderia sp.]|nr:MAG: Probable signal peptide protein [uncultured Paraburkholderia sp.]CAH2928622.1 MAG: Probable signal peptide protein [uncultured Paraburkholderia sp.]
MKKLMIAAVIGALSTTMLSVATDAAAQTATTTKPAAKKATAKRPQPKRLIKRKANPAKEAKVDPVPEGAEKWSCNEGLAFELKGDMKRNQIVTVHWANKNYNLPREATTTGADRFHDAASGMDLVVIPTKAMLFSDKDSSRLADECKTAAMVQGAPAPTQSNAINKTN